MHVVGWVLMGSGVVLFCTVSGYVLVTTVRPLARWVRAWRYDWRSAKHLVAEVEGHYADTAFYGSMDLDAERTVYGSTFVDQNGLAWQEPEMSSRYWPADPVPYEGLQSDARIELAHDWREQTAADLAPEALDVPHEGWESGPYGLVRPKRLCGPEQPQERERSPGNENRDRGTDPAPIELGPRAALVLARWEERRAERWSLVWDNEAAA